MGELENRDVNAVKDIFDRLSISEKQIVFRHIIENFPSLDLGDFPAGLRQELLGRASQADLPSPGIANSAPTNLGIEVPNICTDRVRVILHNACIEAKQHNSSDVGTDHILLGLFKEAQGESPGTAAKILASLSIDLTQAMSVVETLIERDVANIFGRELKLSARARNSIQFACESARTLGHNYVGTEHILLGLLHEKEGVAWQVLSHLGLTSDNVCETMKSLSAAS